MADVFISYARATEVVAKRVESALKAAGHNAWRDDQLPAHRAYSEIIEQRLRGADAVIVLWSKEAAQSQWVRAEADFARTQGKLVQAQLDDTLPPMPFNQIQCADLRGWRGHRNHKGWAKLRESVASVASGEWAKEAEPASAFGRGRFDRRHSLAALAALVILFAAAVFLLPRLMGGGDDIPKVAVLPFKSVGGSDEGVVAGIWEDTRQALSRNPQLLVLGPNTSEEIAKKGSGEARKAADYLVEASVRTAGDRVRVSTNLTRSRDGAQVWSQTFDRKLDDVFALQSEIAQQIEGRIRGRLARGGGKLPEHITTSGEVYALYGEARAKLRQRGPGINEAHSLLQRVVQTDPNFAPGWASLSVAERLRGPTSLEEIGIRGDSEQFARRAIALAPNLAAGHAALGFTLDQRNPLAEAALRKSIELDPNDVETINWLARLVGSRGDAEEALRLYSRAVEIEPLWWVAIVNKLNRLFEHGKEEQIAEEMKRLEQLGAQSLSTRARMELARLRGDLSERVRLGLARYPVAPEEERQMLAQGIFPTLVQLGHHEEAMAISGLPPFALFSWENDQRYFAAFESLQLPPQRFWTDQIVPIVATRTYLNHGRAADIVKLYRAVAASPEEFEPLVAWDLGYPLIAPTVALALRQTGYEEEADRMLLLAAKWLPPAATRQNTYMQVLLSRIYGVQGRKGEALELLARAVKSGWLPELPVLLPDILLDPPLAELRSEPEFERSRRQILDHFAKERAELGPVRLEGVRTAGRRPA